MVSCAACHLTGTEVVNLRVDLVLASWALSEQYDYVSFFWGKKAAALLDNVGYS